MLVTHRLLLESNFVGIVAVFDEPLDVEILFLGEATLPAMPPITDQIVEEPSLQVQARPDADRQVVEIHLVAVLVGKQQRQVTGYGEQEIIVERWKLREGIA